MSYSSLVKTSRTITVVGNFVHMTVGTWLGSLYNYLSFHWLSSKFSHRKKTKYSSFLMIRLVHQASCAEQSVIFCLWRHSLASPHQRWHIDSAQAQSFRFEKGELLRNGVNWSRGYLPITSGIYRSDSGISMTLEPLVDVWHVTTAVESQSSSLRI